MEGGGGVGGGGTGSLGNKGLCFLLRKRKINFEVRRREALQDSDGGKRYKSLLQSITTRWNLTA